MNQALLASSTVSVLSTAAKLGAVAQIRRNLSTRSAAGLSRSREATYAAAYGAWLWHGWLTGQWPEMVSGGIGGALSLVLLGQIGWYEHARPRLLAEVA